MGNMAPLLLPMTVSGPYGQYTVEALVDPGVTFSRVPTPALIEMGIEPVRVVRLNGNDGKAQFAQLGRALTTVGGQEDVTPVLFGDPGTPTIIGAVTLLILLLAVDEASGTLVAVEARAPREVR
jgi:predicted aspartyl protease